ncbi:MAG TPA: response regulator transcription factor [Croceibacterium sp.]
MLQSNSAPGGGARTVLVVDDHPVVRKGVRTIIESMERFEVVGEAGDGWEAIEQAESVRPDIIVLDLAMPRLEGIDTVVELKRRDSSAEILVFTLHQSDHRCLQAIGAGARAYVCKNESDHLGPALEAVSRGRTYLSPAVNEALSLQSKEEAWDRRALTDRERQVVRLVAQGHSNKSIARLLKISIKTTETHRASAMRKTGANSASALTIYAVRNGIVDL